MTTTTEPPRPPTWRRRLLVVAALLLAGVFARLVTGIDPTIALAGDVFEDPPWLSRAAVEVAPGQPRSNPWGRPLEVRPSTGFPSHVWSSGPDGVDQGTSGDDVLLYHGDWVVAARWRWCIEVRRWARPLTLALAALVVLVTAVERAVRAPRGGLALELGRACVLAIIPGAVVVAAVSLGPRWLDADALAAEWSLVGPRTAVAVSGVALCVLAAFFSRLPRARGAASGVRGLTAERMGARARSGTHDLSDSFRAEERRSRGESAKDGQRDA